MLKKAHIPWTVKVLVNQVKKGNVNFDIAIQRGKVWDLERNCLLIHSLIENYPIPPLYFAKREDGLYDGLDGQQREEAMRNYIDGKFPLNDDFDLVVDDIGDEHDFSGLYFNQLPEWAKDNIRDYSLIIYYFEDLTENQYENMFFRLNNGKPFTPTELTRVKAKSLPQFQQLAQHDLVTLAVNEKAMIKYDHETLTMQAWAACFYKNDDFTFETKGFRNIIQRSLVSKAEVSELKTYFSIILNAYNGYNLEDKNEKRIAKKFITRTHLVALTKTLMAGMAKEYEIDQMIEWSRIFFNAPANKGSSIDTAYNSTTGAGSARKDKVDLRFTSMLENLVNFMEEKEPNAGKSSASA